ncbi:peptide chain release factor N(5)-glutamine methyltransferase [Ferruginivarius sediminum]|uniref:Release factor glutamine methyltransferase n=1 Tax=Ferruginivarius sediminum TaxID=2661937 RepID=A0A369T6N6_9PROT|nr:peptide chain release factor N(5)-glutamine methyltransferase [Ferruginivarius sediminum]RDD60991.1 peptide chain release factor N(5)-glutamine methyltransferase [Ferruginivarius sediminum]
MSDAVLARNATIAEALAEAARKLDAAGVPDARRDARVLMAEAVGGDIASVLGRPEAILDDAARSGFDAMIAQRAARRPVSRILGRREFWSLPFSVDASTLDPRPDSETLVEAVLEHVPDRGAGLRLLDLGTGSGCLLLALLRELPNAWGVGVDRNGEAARTAAGNARALGLSKRAAFVAGDWGAALGGGFDVVVCNPPYIADAEMAALSPEVALYDPDSALRAGSDGLDAYRALVPQLPDLVKPGGLAAIEVGYNQAGLVSDLLRSYGLRVKSPVCDLAGVVRCVRATVEAA